LEEPDFAFISQWTPLHFALCGFMKIAEDSAAGQPQLTCQLLISLKADVNAKSWE
jgi:hypothetical protein